MRCNQLVAHTQVLGMEETSYTTVTTMVVDGVSQSITHAHFGKNVFFKAAATLHPPGTLHAGQHQFGFSVTLPKDSPPSSRYGTNTTKCGGQTRTAGLESLLPDTVHFSIVSPNK